MIGRLNGILEEKQAPHLLINVNGVGYEVEAPMTTFYKLPENGQNVTLHTHLIIRDDAHLLFGFASLEERHLFRTLIKVNGVGAKMALAILSGMEAEEFALCINDKDVSRLVKLPGVGKKTAERLIVEMRDKLDGFVINTETSNRTITMNEANDPAAEAISALISLGYKPQEASKFVHAVAGEGMDSEAIIREALKNSVR